jgi:hypothetical protein
VRDDRLVYMALPPLSSPAADEPEGETYGAVIIAESEVTLPALMDVLRGIRFSGWIAPPRGGWIVVLGDPGDGVVADGRRGVIEVGAVLAQRTASPVLAVRVRRDRQLGLVAWLAGDEVGRYCSDPSREPGADKEVLDQPIGAELAGSLAELRDRTDAADELTELLDEELDPDSVNESERLRTVLRMLGLPAWIVAAGALPRDIPTGPKAAELTRLRGGATGYAGHARGPAMRAVRRRQTAPPVIADPPRRSGMGFEEWML